MLQGRPPRRTSKSDSLNLVRWGEEDPRVIRFIRDNSCPCVVSLLYLRDISPTETLICSRVFTQPLRGFVAKKSGDVPYQKPENLLYTRLKLNHTPRFPNPPCLI